MKRLLFLATLAAMATISLPAQMMGRSSGDWPIMGDPMMYGPMARGRAAEHMKYVTQYERAELEALRAELGGKSLGEISGSDLGSYLDRLSIAGQKDAWLVSSMRASMRLPGAGQFMNGDSLGGSLFTAAHAATIVGTMLAWYFLLPSDVRFDQLNYLTTSLSTIKARWEGQSLGDYLPSIGAVAGGMVLDAVWRFWSARSALSEAKAGIDAGKITFQPLEVPGGLGLMLRY